MTLDEFISESLKGIVKGINDSKEYGSQNGAVINPKINQYEKQIGVVTDDYGKNKTSSIYKIDFDIAVTASSQQEKGIGGGISVLSLNVGAKKSDTKENQTVSRIQFSINICLPNGD